MTKWRAELEVSIAIYIFITHMHVRRVTCVGRGADYNWCMSSACIMDSAARVHRWYGIWHAKSLITITLIGRMSGQYAEMTHLLPAFASVSHLPSIRGMWDADASTVFTVSVYCLNMPLISYQTAHPLLYNASRSATHPDVLECRLHLKCILLFIFCLFILWTEHKLMLGPTEPWSIREKLCLASSVMKSGDQNWWFFINKKKIDSSK